MNILGLSAGYHDAAATVINSQGDIVFAGHAERYSKKKNDANINLELIWDACGDVGVDHVAYYETPWKKQLRQLYAGQGIEWSKLTTAQVLQQQLRGWFSHMPYSCHSHHLSHAAGGFQTSLYDRATVVVIDAFGVWDTL